MQRHQTSIPPKCCLRSGRLCCAVAIHCLVICPRINFKFGLHTISVAGINSLAICELTGIVIISMTPRWTRSPLISIAKIKLSPTTLQFYKRVIDTHILPKLGRKRMQDIRPMHVQEFISYLANIDSHNGRGKISSSTARRYLTVLQSIFKQAYKLEIITTNPAKAEKLTLPREVQPKIDIFSKAEAAEMLKCLESEPLAFQTLVQLAIITGARRGE